MDVAIRMQKIELGVDRVVFKPIGIIKGHYDDFDDLFYDELNLQYDSLEGTKIYEENYFYAPISLKEYENIDEVKQFIDELIKTGQYIKETTQNMKDNNNDLFEVDSIDEETANIKAPKTKKVLKKEESKKFNLKSMRDFVLKEIVAQDDAVKSITTTIMKNMEATNPKMKSHILIMGPTGVGKSSTIELICKYLDVPFCKVDATSYTQTGYVGRNTDEILQKLISSADYDIEKAQNGIIVIDEIDKKAKEDKGDVATTAVQQTLLKLTGRGMVEVDINYKGSKSTIDFDTSNLTIVFTGAFEGINELTKKDDIKHIGFINDSKEEKKLENTKVSTNLLTQYGLIPELIGRIKKIVVLNPLKQKDYVQILNYSNSSPIKINKEFFELDKGIKVTFTDSFKIEAAKKAEEFNLGVRGLDRAVDDALEDAMERVLNNEKIKELKFTKSTVNNPKKYYSN